MNLARLASETFRGRTIYRALLHECAAPSLSALTGEVLDLAGDSKAAYRSILPVSARVTTTNLRAGEGEIEADFNEDIPFPDSSFDAVLLFNAIYIADDPRALLSEVRRVLKPGGKVCIASPFISNEMRDPHDYQRFTGEGLERLARDADFSIDSIVPFGERFTAAAYLLNPFFLVAPIRLIAYAVALGLDALIPRRVRHQYPVPLGYFALFAKRSVV